MEGLDLVRRVMAPAIARRSIAGAGRRAPRWNARNTGSNGSGYHLARHRHLRALTFGWFVVVLVAAGGAMRPAAAQGLRIKTGLAASGVGGCAALPPPPPATNPSPTADAEARQLISDAQDAALQGDHARARDAFAQAATLVPGNARVAYYLGRELEALEQGPDAVREYCRYLALSPTAPDADEVRGRVVRLTPANEIARVEDARGHFQSGVALLQRRQYLAADSAFASVSRQVPAAAEPYFNRALSRAARGDREAAMQDFEKYLELAPQAADRAVVRTSMTRLPDRVYGSGQAFGSGLLVPGMGQMSTGRPIMGVLTLGAVGGAIAVALKSVPELRTSSYNDPFGNSYVDSVTVSARPNAATWLPVAGVLWLGSAIESARYARRSRARAEAIIAGTTSGRVDVGLAVAALPRQRLGLGVALTAR